MNHPNIATARGRIAYYSRADVGDPTKVAQARCDLRAAEIEQAVREALTATPPITPDQRASITALLNGGAR